MRKWSRNFVPSPKSVKRLRRLRPSSKKSDYLRNTCATLEPEHLPIATIYFTGKPFPQSDLRTLQVGWSVIFRALIGASKLTEAGIPPHREQLTATPARPHSKRSTGELHRNRSRLWNRESFSTTLQKTRGPLNKTELLRDRFAKLSAREGQYVVKILTGDLRIGLREGLVEEAIANAFDAPLDEVKEANMLLGDIGQTALLAVARRARSRRAFPFSSDQMHAREPGADGGSDLGTLFATDAPNEVDAVYVEDKFDGIRAQLHRGSERVEIFSRDLRRMTDQFIEIAEQARNFRRRT